MILDYNPATLDFFVRAPRGSQPDAGVLMREYGLDMSVAASTPAEAVLFTKNPFAAASFWRNATGRARERLGWIMDEIAASSAPSSNRHVALPPDKELMPFQRADVDYLMRRDHGLDGDEPGLGKTPTAIAIANEMQAQRVIVVCPASIRLQWLRKIREWSTMRDPFAYAVVSSRYGVSDRAEWTVISYDLARKPPLLRALVKQRFDLLIVDECHYLKEESTKRSRAVFGYHDGRIDDGESDEVVTACLAEVCTRVLPLSGTPLPNRPAEAWVPLRNLNHESVDWMSKASFMARFNPRQMHETATGKVWVQEEQGRLPELQNRLRAYVMCRHTKSQVKDQLRNYLGEVVWDLVQVEETRAVRAVLEKERMLDINPDGFEWNEIDGQISTVRREMGEAMAPQLADYIAMLLDGGEDKLVCFAWHKSVIAFLAERLAPYGVVTVDGADSGPAKDRKARMFVEQPGLRLILGNVLSLGTGVDGLQQVCAHALVLEPDWVPGNNVQCVDRLDRIGQTLPVRADLFVAPGSILENILGGALRKGGVLHKVLDRSVSEAV